SSRDPVGIVRPAFRLGGNHRAQRPGGADRTQGKIPPAEAGTYRLSTVTACALAAWVDKNKPTPQPQTSRSFAMSLPRFALAVLASALIAGPAAAAESLLNVSYDPTRELYSEFNAS